MVFHGMTQPPFLFYMSPVTSLNGAANIRSLHTLLAAPPTCGYHGCRLLVKPLPAPPHSAFRLRRCGSLLTNFPTPPLLPRALPRPVSRCAHTIAIDTYHLSRQEYSILGVLCCRLVSRRCHTIVTIALSNRRTNDHMRA